MNLPPVRSNKVAKGGGSKLQQTKASGNGGNGATTKDAKGLAAGRETLAPATKAKLMAALKETVYMRPEVLLRGLMLASDPNYPSADIFREIAKRLLEA